MENVLEPKEAFNLFKVPTKLENIITALVVSIISNNQIISKEIVNKTKIGIAIESLNSDNLLKAIIKILDNYEFYQDKIKQFNKKL